jgi:DNA-binding transcriptional MocR family regulator
MKTDTVFKRAFNDALDLVSRLSQGEQLPSENRLSVQLGVSGTKVRKVIASLEAGGIVTGGGRYRNVSPPGDAAARFPVSETVPMATGWKSGSWSGCCAIMRGPAPRS